MEFRASHLAIGALVLLIVLSVPALLIWSSKSTGQNPAEHYVRFVGSVAGLEIGSRVLLGGIPIGRVTAVRIDPQRTSLARVDITVDGAAPIYSDSRATIQSQGISGNVVIDISRGGRMRSQRLKPGEEIAAVYSPIRKLLLGLSEMMTRGDLLIDRISAFLDARDVSMANQILANIDKLRIQWAAEAPAFDILRAETDNAVAQLRQAQTDFRQAALNIDRLTVAAKAAKEEIQNLTAAFGKTATNLGQFVEDNRRPIEDFSSNGFLQLSPLISEFHRLERNVGRLWSEMRQDPTRFFLTDRQQQGFQPPPSINQHH